MNWPTENPVCLQLPIIPCVGDAVLHDAICALNWSLISSALSRIAKEGGIGMVPFAIVSKNSSFSHSFGL